MKITFDLETRSEAELGEVGTWNYSRHPSTKVLCLAYTIDHEDRTKYGMWLPPSELLRYQFNCSAYHKSLQGHFHVVRGNRVRIAAKRLEKIVDERVEVPLNECKLAKEKRQVTKGFKFDGFLIKPKFARLKLEMRPNNLIKALNRPDCIIEAHNVFFEKSIWFNILQPRHGFPTVADDKWRCSAALAASHSLPRALDKVGEILDLPVQKDQEGKLVMMQLAKPIKRDGEFVGWYNDPQRFTTLYSYCMDDVLSEREISKKLVSLSSNELKVWQLNQLMNTKGVPIDPDIVKGAITIIENYTKVLEARMAELTNGRLNNIRQTAILKIWLEERGVLTDSVDKSHVETILARKNLPDDVREVLEIRQKLGQTSTAKYIAMKNQLCSDNTIKDQYMYHGAISGRETGRGVQVSNLPRGTLVQTPEMLRDIKSGSWKIVKTHGDPMDVLSSCIRGAIAAPKGTKMLVSDFSNIEGRITAWVAGEQWKLDAFLANDKGEGPDIYKLAFAKAFEKEIDDVSKDDRQVGKILELACGYSGWLGAYHAMAGVYGVKVSDKEAKEQILKWRDRHPKLVPLWSALELAAKEAILTGREQVVNDKVAYDVKGDFLRCILPNGKALHYYKPLVEEVETPWGSKSMQVSYLASKGNGPPFRNGMWKGIFIENYAQGVAREILVEGMQRLTKYGYDVRLSTYDEVMALVPDNNDWTIEMFDEALAESPEWLKGMPLACEGFEDYHYRKD